MYTSRLYTNNNLREQSRVKTWHCHLALLEHSRVVVLTFHNRSVTVRLQFVYPPPPPYIMAGYGLWVYVMLCYVTCVILCYVMLCSVLLCYVMLCYVMLCYVMLCYVTVIRYMYKSFVKCKDFNCTCCK